MFSGRGNKTSPAFIYHIFNNMKTAVPQPSEKVTPPESGKSPSPELAIDCWFDDSCTLDLDYFIKTLHTFKAKGVSPDVIGSIISRYAANLLPDLSPDDAPARLRNPTPESATATWKKKRFLVETLVGVLPPGNKSVSCDFLLRLLRTANAVGAEPSYRTELERRISWQLDKASVKELMIPAFGNTCGTLLDVELVLRLVRRFICSGGPGRSGAALVKVAKLVDSYMAEAALDGNLSLPEFVALGGALPEHARAANDGLYGAIDTYLMAHPDTSKQERMALCRLIDSRKLSAEASLHAAQNERLPVRAVIQVLFSEQASGSRSTSPTGEPSDRRLSKHEVSKQQLEILKLQEDLMRLQILYHSMQVQMDKLIQKKKNKGLFRWVKLGMPVIQPNCGDELEDATGEQVEG